MKKHAVDIVVCLASLGWLVFIVGYMIQCAKGQIEFVGRRGTPLELPLMLGVVTLAFVPVIVLLDRAKKLNAITLILAFLSLLGALIVLCWAFFQILAVA